LDILVQSRRAKRAAEVLSRTLERIALVLST
jgi:hypothetical protein